MNNNKKNVTIDQAQAVDDHIKANRSTATVWQRIGKVFTTKVIPLLLVLILVIMPTVLVACNFVPDDPDKDDSGIVKPGEDEGNTGDNTDNEDGDNENQGGQGGEQGGNESGDGNQGGQGGSGNEGGEQGGEDGDQGETEIKPEPVDDLDDLYMAKPDASSYTNGTEDAQYIADMQKYQNAQQMKKQLYQNFETYLKDDMVFKIIRQNGFNEYDLNNVSNGQWRLVSEQNNETIDKIIFTCTYAQKDTNYIIAGESVTPAITTTLTDLLDTTKYSQIFNKDIFTGDTAKFRNEYSFNYNPTEQENAFYIKIKNALIANETLPQEDENTEILIKCTNDATNHPTMGLSSGYKFLVKTNNAVKDVYVTIDHEAFNDGVLNQNEFDINPTSINVSYPEQVLDESVLTA